MCKIRWMLCKFECVIGLRVAQRERKNTCMKTEVSFVFLMTVGGLPVTNCMDYVGFSCISCQPLLPSPPCIFFPKLDCPIICIFHRSNSSGLQTKHFFAISRVAFYVSSFAVSASCFLIPTSGCS